VKLFVTGATGFIGRVVVEAAVTRGHDVVALTRAPSTDSPASAGRGSEQRVVGDVRRPEEWMHGLEGCDAVLHLAIVHGSPVDQWDVLVHGTHQLVAAMLRRGVRRLVLVSSMSVYDYAALDAGAMVDESTPLEPAPEGRDDYTRAKLAQEAVVTTAPGLQTSVLRLGAVYGVDRLWNAGLALRLPGGPGFDIGSGGSMKLTYVENAGLAIVLASERGEAVGTVVNVVDDDLPSPARFADALRRHGLDAPRAVPVPYAVVSGLARCASGLNRRLLRGRVHLPEIAVPARLGARFKPLRYSNRAARQVLGWAPPFDLDQALARIADRSVR